MPEQHSKKFKEDLVHYYNNLYDLGAKGCAGYLDIGYRTLTKWMNELCSTGEISVRGFGNCSTDKQ